MLVKLVEEVSAPFIDNVFCYYNQPKDIREEKIKPFVLDGKFKFEVYYKGEWINAKKYFNKYGMKKTTVVTETIELTANSDDKENKKEKVKKEKVEKENDIEELKKQAEELGINNYWVMKESTLKKKIKEKLSEE